MTDENDIPMDEQDEEFCREVDACKAKLNGLLDEYGPYAIFAAIADIVDDLHTAVCATICNHKDDKEVVN
jgi:hypothetical protein